MTIKTWFKTVIKKLNWKRKEAYKNALNKRCELKEEKYSSVIANRIKDYPEYIKEGFNCLNTFNIMKKEYHILKYCSMLDLVYKRYIEALNNIEDRINNIFPKERETFDLNTLKFVTVTNAWGNEYIGFIYFHVFNEKKERTKVYGYFFNDNGDRFKMDIIDKTYLVKPMRNDNDYKHFMNLYFNILVDRNPADIEKEVKKLSELWDKQLTYLKLKE